MSEIIGDDEQRELADTVYDFPCFIPVTVIGSDHPSLYEKLEDALRYIQDGAEFEIVSGHSSKKGKYISFKISLLIGGAEELLEKRNFLRNLDGVLLVI